MREETQVGALPHFVSGGEVIQCDCMCPEALDGIVFIQKQSAAFFMERKQSSSYGRLYGSEQRSMKLLGL